MSFKEVYKAAITTFLITTSALVLFSFLFIVLLHPQAQLGGTFFGQLLTIALAAGASAFLFYSRKELSNRKMWIRILLHFAVLYTAMLALLLNWRWILPKGSHILYVSVGYVVGYVLVWTVLFIENQHTARQLNQIIARRKNHL